MECPEEDGGAEAKAPTVVTGKVPNEVHLLGLRRQRLEWCMPELELCRHCSCWGHREWRCQYALRCRTNRPSFLYAAPHLPQPSCSTTGTSAALSVFPLLPQHIATVPSASSTTMPQPGDTQELPAINSTQFLIAVVNGLAAKVDNLSKMVSDLSNQFATFKKKQQQTVPDGTPPVVPTPCPVSDTMQDQGDTATPSLRKPVKGAKRQPPEPLASPIADDMSPEADCDGDTASEWTLVTHRKRLCSNSFPVQTANPEPDQGYVMSAL
ncbi:hypothetical protein E2C01_052911 [Portunus trituberculatus]|uniref:Uncharacterized protein n=1 Tax=Portunus trituberculatus TaxID=210409 RepID=A0A5B7GMR6_PORTR|nr:hypothetical protein [Portunus trituberculatus]